PARPRAHGRCPRRGAAGRGGPGSGVRRLHAAPGRRARGGGMSVELGHYLALSGIVFGIGVAIALSKRNAIAVLMGVELMLNAVNLTLLSFARFGSAFAGNEEALAGHVFVVFVLTVAAAEA